MKFTQKAIPGPDLLKGRSEAIIFDDNIPGFGVRLRAGGGHAWVFQYKLGDRHRRITFGKLSAMSAEDARRQAVKLHAKVKLGTDPAIEKVENKARASETFGAVLQGFLRRQKRFVKARSYIETERYLLKHFAPFHGLPIGSIGRRTVAARLAELVDECGPVAADRARAWLSAFFTWAMREGLVEANPVVGTNRPGISKPRDRVLSDDELREVWNALGQHQFGDIVRLLVLTGQRLAEIGDLRWSEVDLAAGVLRLAPERVKNGRPHRVPLSAMARAIIEAQPRRLSRDLVFGHGQGGFAGWGHCKARLDQGIIDARKAADPKAKPVAGWRLHDIRRTCATRLGDLGTQPHVVEAVLNHVSGSKSGIAGTYNRAPYEAEKRSALVLWAEHVRSIVEQSERKIAALRA